MKPILSKAQLDYMKAKNQFENRAKVLEKEITAKRATQEITQEAMEELVQTTGFHDAYNDLILAENALIDWSHSTIKHEKTYRENREAIDAMYENVNSSPEKRQEMIQLSMKIR
ncbi:hypothetical protein F4V43_17260 [Paenibacillus spiritus]|uniref:Uncharacterized protein n=1 Tax=Paenibacillus spiritus TaxID=2496557 RepID=A0A5J5FWR9_9BACL|nr:MULTISPECIES: hypothetical protein [Paenibacillus]KAA8998001.1 hypothetical protein F4V43_17260 [Paenibacillus spiritus]